MTDTTATARRAEPATSFVGREPELAEGARLLAETRLLTITGPGGTGKTRYATELARRVEHGYETGPVQCLFASLRDPKLVLPTIAHAFGIAERGGGGALELIAERIGESQALLFLDNLEHLLAASPELAELVASCPRLTVLCTSRQRLGVESELAYELPPLADEESVALFCERARVAPSDGIRELCARLEGLPLAIELAAARLALLSPEQLLQRLGSRLDVLKGPRDADPRQQTLRATIEWSHDLLSPEEKQLFARLSVFRGGCTLEAAEAVCDAGLDALESLLDKSLMRRLDSELGPRFWMLETIRELAAEQLDASAEGQVFRGRQARYFIELVRTVAPKLRGSSAGSAVDVLELELENVREAFAYAREAGEGELVLELAAELWFFHEWRGRYAEGSEWLEVALAESEAGSLALRAKALNRSAIAADERGESELARRRNEESVELARAAGDRETEAAALHDLAGWYGSQGAYEEAARRYSATLPLFQELGETSGVVVAMANVGLAYRRLGRFDEALSWHRQAARLGRELGNDYYLVIALSELAVSELEANGPAEGVVRLQESAKVALDTRNLGLLPWSLWWLAVACARAHAYAAAARLAGAAERMLDESGRELDDFDREWIAEGLSAPQAALGGQTYDEARAEGAAMTADEAVAFALELDVV